MLEKNRGRQKRLYYHKKQIYEHYLKPKYTHSKFYNVHTRKRSSNLKELDDDYTYNKILNSTFSNEIKTIEITENNKIENNLNNTIENFESNKENCSNYSNNVVSTFPNTINSNLLNENIENQKDEDEKKIIENENEIKEFNSSSFD